MVRWSWGFDMAESRCPGKSRLPSAGHLSFHRGREENSQNDGSSAVPWRHKSRGFGPIASGQCGRWEPLSPSPPPSAPSSALPGGLSAELGKWTEQPLTNVSRVASSTWKRSARRQTSSVRCRVHDGVPQWVCRRCPCHVPGLRKNEMSSDLVSRRAEGTNLGTMWKLVLFSKTRRNVDLLGKLGRRPLVGTRGAVGQVRTAWRLGVPDHLITVGNSVDEGRVNGSRLSWRQFGRFGTTDTVHRPRHLPFPPPNSTCAPRDLTSPVAHNNKH